MCQDTSIFLINIIKNAIEKTVCVLINRPTESFADCKAVRHRSHENVIKYFFHDEIEHDRMLFVMEYVEGVSDLEKVIQDPDRYQKFRKDPKQVFGLFKQIVTALQHIHSGY